MKKKLLAIFLAVAMIATLAACGNGQSDPTNPSETKGPSETEGNGPGEVGNQGDGEIGGYYSFSYSAGDVGQAYRYLTVKPSVP